MTAQRSLRARPVCAICGTAVEEFTEEDGEGPLRGFVLFVARCHGEIERQKVRRAETKGMNFGIAFGETKAISSPGVRGLLEAIDV